MGVAPSEPRALNWSCKIPCCRHDNPFCLWSKNILSLSHSPWKWEDEKQVLNYLDHPGYYFNLYKDLGQFKSDPGFKKPYKVFLYPGSQMQNAILLTFCFSWSNKVFTKDCPYGCRPKNDSLLLPSGVSLVQHTCHPFCVVGDRTSPHPGISLMSASWTIQSCITYWGTLDGYLIYSNWYITRNIRLLTKGYVTLQITSTAGFPCH